MLAADDADVGLRRALQQAVVEAVHERHRCVGLQAEAHDGVVGDAGHGAEVGQVHAQRLAPDESRRRPVALEVHAFDEAIRGDERLRRRLHGRSIVADADLHPDAGGDARSQISDEGVLPPRPRASR